MNREKWIVYAIVSMFFAGLTSVIAKFGLKQVSGDTGLAVRTVVVFILVWGNALFLQGSSQFRALDRASIIFLAISGVTTSLSWIFYYRAIKLGPVSQLALIDKVEPPKRQYCYCAASVGMAAERTPDPENNGRGLTHFAGAWGHSLEIAFSPLRQVQF